MAFTKEFKALVAERNAANNALAALQDNLYAPVGRSAEGQAIAKARVEKAKARVEAANAAMDALPLDRINTTPRATR